jgi:hypothetical protein
MGRCKVRICRLPLAPGALTGWTRETSNEVQDIEAEHILAREHLQHVVDLSVVASSARRVQPHVHGVDGRIKGRFWASNNSSDSDEEDVDMIDWLVNSLGHLSTSSPSKPSVVLSGQKEGIGSMMMPYQEPTVANHSLVCKEARLSGHSGKLELRPWQGLFWR